jgi:hypothetical protein
MRVLAAISLRQSPGRRPIIMNWRQVGRDFQARGFQQPFFLTPASLMISPGPHASAEQIFSIVSKLIPRALPFFSLHKVVWLMPVSLASQ